MHHPMSFTVNAARNYWKWNGVLTQARTCDSYLMWMNQALVLSATMGQFQIKVQMCDSCYQNTFENDSYKIEVANLTHYVCW